MNTEFNENVDKPTWGVTWFIGTLAIVVGYLLGWMTHYDETTKVWAFIVACILLMAVKRAKDFHAQQLVAYSELVRIHRLDEYELVEKKLKVMKKDVQSQVVQPQSKHDFTSEDFTDDAKNIINPVVIKAKRTKTKVTGQGLVDSFLKTLR